MKVGDFGYMETYLSSVPYGTQFYDVSNQQDATTFSFINLLNRPYMFRATNSPILRSTLTEYTGLVQRTVMINYN